MLIDNLKNTLNIWIRELENYDLISLQTKPCAVEWSLGQLYIHVIEETDYYLEPIKICLANDDNQAGESTSDAKTMFLNNDFPNEKIKGAPTHNLILQPESKEQLAKGLINLKDAISSIEIVMSKSRCKGKTRHPGLGYFNAAEWLQFAEMHMRHHLRQKKRIDDFLKANG